MRHVLPGGTRPNKAEGNAAQFPRFIGQCGVTSRPSVQLAIRLARGARGRHCLPGRWSRDPPTSACGPAIAALFGDAAEPARTVVHGTARTATAVGIHHRRAAGARRRAAAGAVSQSARGFIRARRLRRLVGRRLVRAAARGIAVGRAVFGGARRDVGHVPGARAGARRRHRARAAHRRRGRERLRRARDAGAGAGRQRPVARHDVLAGRRSRLGGASVGHAGRGLVSHAAP